MTEVLLNIVYILSAIYFVIGIVSFWRYDKVTRKADKMLQELENDIN